MFASVGTNLYIVESASSFPQLPHENLENLLVQVLVESQPYPFSLVFSDSRIAIRKTCISVGPVQNQGKQKKIDTLKKPDPIYDCI